MIQSKKCNQSGFTLIEILSSVVILTIGILALYQPLLMSLDVLTYADNRMEANYLIDRRVWEIENKITQEGKFPRNPTRDQVIGSQKIFDLSTVFQSIGASEYLRKVQFIIAWQDMRHTQTLKRELYLLKPIKKK